LTTDQPATTYLEPPAHLDLAPAVKFDDTDPDLLLHIDPADPLNVNHLLAAERRLKREQERWDAELADAHARWDEIAPTPPGGWPAAMTGEAGDEADEAGPPAKTAGEEDHSNPWTYAGEDADPPADTGRPPDEPASVDEQPSDEPPED
jgi:hypothetical protein